MSWIKNISLIFVSLVVLIATLEFGLRIVFPEKINENLIKTRDHSDPYFPKHTVGPHVNKFRNTTANFLESGFRVNPNTCKVKSEALNVLLVGDSNIAGFFLDDSETLGAKLTELSMNTQKCVNVETFGVSGFGPDQVLFAIDKFTESRAYDVVIFHIFADNDLGDLIRNNYASYDKIENNGYCYMEPTPLENSLLYQAVRKAWWIMTDSDMGYHTVSSVGNKTCAFAITSASAASYSHAQRLLARAEIDLQLNLQGRRQPYMGDRYDIEFACAMPSAAATYATSTLKMVVRKIDKLKKERKFNIVYLIEPSEFDVTDNHPERSAKECSNYSPENITKFFTRELPSQQTINLFENFNGCNECYFTKSELGDDNHWSPRGIERAAIRLLQHHSFQ
jgi:hypothetical protein